MRSTSQLLAHYGFSAQSHFIIEGRIAVTAALKNQWPIDLILHSADQDHPTTEIRTEQIAKSHISELLGFNFHRGQLALARRKKSTFPGELNPKNALSLVALAGLADPGNIGTIIRNAAAFGADAIICDSQGADPFNAKSVRASATSIFSIPVFQHDLSQWEPPNSYQKIATSLGKNSIPLPTWNPEKTRGRVIYFGSEGPGLDDHLISTCDTLIQIPHSTSAESLNVASSSAIILYHLQQQLLQP